MSTGWWRGGIAREALVKAYCRRFFEKDCSVLPRGDHAKFKPPGIPGHVVVPHPRKDMPVGTLRNIYRQAGWEWR